MCTVSQEIFAAFHTALLDLPFFKLVSFSRSCYKSYTVLEEEVQVLMAHRVLLTVRRICSWNVWFNPEHKIPSSVYIWWSDCLHSIGVKHWACVCCWVWQDDNHKLAIELQSAIAQCSDVMEKYVRSETTREDMRVQLQQLKQQTGYVNCHHHRHHHDGYDDAVFSRLLSLSSPSSWHSCPNREVYYIQSLTKQILYTTPKQNVAWP